MSSSQSRAGRSAAKREAKRRKLWKQGERDQAELLRARRKILRLQQVAKEARQ